MNLPYNVFRVDKKCLDLDLDTKILTCLGHNYIILKISLRDQMVIFICIFHRFCTELTK